MTFANINSFGQTKAKQEILFCNTKSDTLLLDEVLNCGLIANLSDPSEKIVIRSYSLSFLDRGQLHEYHTSGPSLSPEMKQVISKSRSNISKLMFSNITYQKGNKKCTQNETIVRYGSL